MNAGNRERHCPRILIDGNTLQGRVHLYGMHDGPHRVEPRTRLNWFIKLAESPSLGGIVDVSPCHSDFVLSSSLLARYDVLVIPTRERVCTYSEVRNIEGFVHCGGGLWLMSNHTPHHVGGASIARLFGIEFGGSFIHLPGQRICIDESNLNLSHPVLAGPNPPDTEVRNIVINNSDCIISSDGAQRFAHFPNGSVDRVRHDSRRDKTFAASIEVKCAASSPPMGMNMEQLISEPSVCTGRVLATGDSGFIGTAGTNYPGPGLIAEGDNARFVVNAIAWLAGLDREHIRGDSNQGLQVASRCMID